jgi:hypothetical protein
MPAKSVAQRRLMAIAEHAPSKLNKKNKGVLRMSHQQLHEFADTKESNLPEHTAKKHAGGFKSLFQK